MILYLRPPLQLKGFWRSILDSTTILLYYGFTDAHDFLIMGADYGELGEWGSVKI